jgi:hypothetical protein
VINFQITELNVGKLNTSKLLSTAAFWLCIFHAQADMLTECNAIASQISKSTPQNIDQITTLITAICFQEDRTVRLQYRNKLSVPASSISQANLNTIRPQMVTSWCTDPTQKSLLNLISIQYHYSDNSGRYIGKIDISKTDCR